MATVHTGARRGPDSWRPARAVAYFLLTGSLLLGGRLVSARAEDERVVKILAYRPKQEGVNYTTPTAEEQKSCTVEVVKGRTKGSGWLLKDKDGNALRRFFDTNGDNHIDVWSYYKDGVEVYCEIDSTFTAGRPDQYRWLNSGGMKWGVDEDRDGRIDSWKAISPEEVSQEILQALVTHDYRRLQALMISDKEMQALELPAAEVTRIQ